MDNEDMILNAKRFAYEKHKGQKRKDGITSYTDHLEGVVHRLKNIGITEEDTICAAWLHDVLEKTDATLEEVIQKFGKKVATLVLSLSKNYELSKKEMETQYIQQLKDAPLEAKIIKLCDISSNLKNLSGSSISKTQKNKKIRQILQYMRAIQKEISEKKSRHPKVMDIIEGINSVAIKFKQRPFKLE